MPHTNEDPDESESSAASVPDSEQGSFQATKRLNIVGAKAVSQEIDHNRAASTGF